MQHVWLPHFSATEVTCARCVFAVMVNEPDYYSTQLTTQQPTTRMQLFTRCKRQRQGSWRRRQWYTRQIAADWMNNTDWWCCHEMPNVRCQPNFKLVSVTFCQNFNVLAANSQSPKAMAQLNRYDDAKSDNGCWCWKNVQLWHSCTDTPNEQ